jgi:hypothetical protein
MHGLPVLDVVDVENQKSYADAPGIELMGGSGPTMERILEEGGSYGDEADVRGTEEGYGADGPPSGPRTVREGRPEYGYVNKPGESNRAQEERLERNRRRLAASLRSLPSPGGGEKRLGTHCVQRGPRATRFDHSEPDSSSDTAASQPG